VLPTVTVGHGSDQAATPTAPRHGPLAGGGRTTNPSVSDDGQRARARAERRERLLDAADRAVRELGTEVSMDAVAAEAGITKPVLYRHFGDREGLLAAVASRHAHRLVHELQGALAAQHHPHERLRTTIDTYLAFVERDPELHRSVARVAPGGRLAGTARNGTRSSPMADALGTVCDQVTAAIRDELTAAELDPAPARTWGESLVGMVQLVGDRWLDDEHPPTRAELVARLTDLLWGGFTGIGLRDEDREPSR
jgi:AcrR family transcriptional regulator